MNSKMEASLKDINSKEKEKDGASIATIKEDIMKENGKMISCVEKASFTTNLEN